MCPSFTPEGMPDQPFSTVVKKPEQAALPSPTPPSAHPPAAEPTKFLPVIALKMDALPSKGLSYPANAEIKYRPYTFGEVKKASQSKLSFKDNIEFVLEGIDTNFSKYDLTLFDMMYLSLLRNISSVKGAAFRVEFKCPGCGKAGFHELDMAKLEFRDIEAPKLPIRVNLAGRDCIYMPLTLKHFFSLIDIGKETDEIALVAVKIVNMPFQEAYDLIFNTAGDDQETVMEVEKLLMHEVLPLKFKCGIKSEINKQMVKCDQPITIELAGGEALVIPFRKSKDSARSRLQFG